MELHLMHFLIVCPLVFLAGFVDAVAGGGGLISLPAYMIAGLPVHFAIGTNKLSSGMGTTLATARFAKNGYIAWKNALLCIVTALIGSSLGAKLALQLDDYYFKRLILVILPCTALYLTFGKPFVGEKESFPVRKMILFSALIAFIIGIYDGFYGPGTGTFLLLLLTGIAHMGLKEANGITKAINLTTNLTALAVYLMNGKVIFLLGLIAGIFSIAGNYLGTRCFDKGGAKFVKPLMMVVLVIFFIKTLSEILGAYLQNPIRQNENTEIRWAPLTKCFEKERLRNRSWSPRRGPSGTSATGSQWMGLKNGTKKDRNETSHFCLFYI
jgi:uncharacterized membrane protein YfcA